MPYLRIAHRPTRPHRIGGSALLESLIAFLVLSLGMLTVTRLQTHLRLQADVSRQRSEAVRLAQADLETLRGFAVLQSAPGKAAYAEIATQTHVVNAADGYASQTEYRVERQIDAAASLHAKSATVTVGWTDLGGSAQQVVLQSIIAATDPSFSGALALARGTVTSTGPYDRSGRIPLAAKDLGDGRSVFKPVSNGSVALLMDNANGRVTGRCTSVDPAIVTADLTLAALAGCDANPGLLLSGKVRFTSSSPPNLGQAREPPLPLSMVLTPADGPYPLTPWCAVEALKTVSYESSGLQFASVPLAAPPSSLGLASWTDTGDRQMAYRCVLYPTANGTWSGRSTLVANGWTIGTGAADRRVCRYSSDLDGSGAIDVNIEHPADYVKLDASLAEQNFLVINGTDNCPTGLPIQIAGKPSDVFADLSTSQHQP